MESKRAGRREHKECIGPLRAKTLCTMSATDCELEKKKKGDLDMQKGRLKCTKMHHHVFHWPYNDGGIFSLFSLGLVYSLHFPLTARTLFLSILLPSSPPEAQKTSAPQ